MTDLLSEVNSPDDLKKLNRNDLPALSEEIRDVLLKRISVTGGHLGSNLGVVEATVALHYVFDSPKDKIVWDVSHESYTHKILTGRKLAFTDPAHYHDVSGYTHPSESPHDQFTVGHTGTSISMAVGLAKGRDLCGRHENVIAFIGDGSMSEGEAFEGLDNAGAMSTNLIIVFNDNGWAIAPNHGGIYKSLAELRATNGESEHNMFKDFGLDYRYVADGNDVEKLVDVFASVKDIDHPVVVHIVTDKGRGSAWAEKDKEAGHWALPDKVYDEIQTERKEGTLAPDYDQITSEFLLKKIEHDPKVVVLTAATPGSALPPSFREKAGKQFVDVSIAEQHAVAAISGIGKAGGKPVFEVFNTFLQRAYDQLQQDLALQGNPATILMGGIAPGVARCDNTHSGAFGIAMTNTIPGLTCLAPATKEELLGMLDWSIDHAERPVVIVRPLRGVVSEDDLPLAPVDPPFAGDGFGEADLSYRTMVRGEKVAVLALGDMLMHGYDVVKALKDRLGIDATLIEPRIYSALDTATLDRLLDEHDIVLTIEDGEKVGGFGEQVASYYGSAHVHVLNYGANKEIPDLVPTDELMERYGMTTDQIVGDVESLLGNE